MHHACELPDTVTDQPLVPYAEKVVLFAKVYPSSVEISTPVRPRGVGVRDGRGIYRIFRLDEQ